MLPGYTADDTIMTNIEILKIPTTCRSRSSSSVRVRSGSSLPLSSRASAAEVTILEALPRIVNAEDEDISKELLRLYKKRGIDVHVGAKVDKIEKNKDGAALVSLSPSPTALAQTKTGREGSRRCRPRPAHLRLRPRQDEHHSLDRGFIMTNEWMETTEPGVYAIGDIVGGPAAARPRRQPWPAWSSPQRWPASMPSPVNRHPHPRLHLL